MKNGGPIDRDDPVDIVEGLFVPSTTESLRIGGVGGIAVLWLVEISCDGYDVGCLWSVAIV